MGKGGAAARSFSKSSQCYKNFFYFDSRKLRLVGLYISERVCLMSMSAENITNEGLARRNNRKSKSTKQQHVVFVNYEGDQHLASDWLCINIPSISMRSYV